MKEISAIPTIAQPAFSLAPPEQLAQQAANAVRELLAEAAAAKHRAQLRQRPALLGRLACGVHRRRQRNGVFSSGFGR